MLPRSIPLPRRPASRASPGTGEVSYSVLPTRRSGQLHRIFVARYGALCQAYHGAIRRSRPSRSGGGCEAAREVLRELANVKMDLSLEDWCRISNTILAALSASSVASGVKAQYDLQRSLDFAGDANFKAGRDLWNVIDWRGEYRGQIALTVDEADALVPRRTLSCLSHPAQGWREMASAPRDGTSILAAHDKAAIVVYWQEERTTDGAPGWADGETDLDGYFHTYPVFVWQPLPPLPSAPAGGSGNE